MLNRSTRGSLPALPWLSPLASYRAASPPATSAPCTGVASSETRPGVRLAVVRRHVRIFGKPCADSVRGCTVGHQAVAHRAMAKRFGTSASAAETRPRQGVERFNTRQCPRVEWRRAVTFPSRSTALRAGPRAAIAWRPPRVAHRPGLGASVSRAHRVSSGMRFVCRHAVRKRGPDGRRSCSSTLQAITVAASARTVFGAFPARGTPAPTRLETYAQDEIQHGSTCTSSFLHRCTPGREMGAASRQPSRLASCFVAPKPGRRCPGVQPGRLTAAWGPLGLTPSRE